MIMVIAPHRSAKAAAAPARASGDASEARPCE